MAMNNNRCDYPAINGMQIKEMLLEDWDPPDRAASSRSSTNARRGRGAVVRGDATSHNKAAAATLTGGAY